MAARAKSKSESVLEVLAGASDWKLFYGPTGKAFFKIASSRGGQPHTVTANSCTCPSDQFRRGGARCKHVLAARTYSRIIAAFRAHEAQKEAMSGSQGASERRGESPAGGR